MRSIQEYRYKLLYFWGVKLFFNGEMQEINFSRTDYKLLFLDRHAFKDEKT